MIKPTRDTFENLAGYDVIPLYLSYNEDHHTPIGIFEKIKGLHPTFLLESAGEHQDSGRYSYIGLDTEDISLQLASLESLEQQLKDQRIYRTQELPPFYYGYIGYLSYNSVHHYYKVGTATDQDFQVLQCKTMLIFDHYINKLHIVYNAMHDPEDYERGLRRIQKLYDLIQSVEIIKEEITTPNSLIVSSNVSKDDFKSMVLKGKAYIESGDIFQVVLSQKFTAPLNNLCPFELYKSLRRENPSPYLSYIRFKDRITICSSPEMLLKFQDGTVETAPIAGTRPVKSDGKDNQRMHELLNDQKELSEHLMLVDLGRNDIGKVSKSGTVRVEKFCEVKQYSKVMHLVSSVKGTLKEDETSMSAMISTFPAGTVSGAPKKRALEIIDELEPDQRDLYAGALFYLNFDGNLNSCIAIRTMTIQKELITIQCGAGIVHDSNPDHEYKETINKAKALFNALESFYKGGLTYDFNH